jgi:hypothetical protein
VSTTIAWELGPALAVVLFIALFMCLQLNSVRNERLINSAITAMRDAISAELAPQRALLHAVADTLTAQDRAAARIEIAIHTLALRDAQLALPLPDASDLIKQLLELPEPQRLIADFLAEHAGAPVSGTTFRVIAAEPLHKAIADVFADLARDHPIELERLQDLAADGAIAAVAAAGLTAPPLPGMPPFRAPRVADVDIEAMTAIVRALSLTARRQLRLATLLHGQAEALLRTRRAERRPLARLRWRLHQILQLPLVRRPQFSHEEPARAIELLAGLRMPVPAGLPGRIYHLESLAQAQPTAVFGVWHRLAMSRWLAAGLAAVDSDVARTHWFGEPAESSEYQV